MNSVVSLLGGTQGLPHGACLLWETGLVWLQVISDAFIALAYYAILMALVYVVRQRRDMAFPWMFLLFGAFLFTGGTTHLFSIWTLWQPVYWLEGLIKTGTAGVSVATAVLLVPLIPKALALPSPAQVAAANHALQAEIAERERADEALRALANTLEQRVEERTAALTQTNQALQAEMAERQRAEGELVRLNRELQHRITEFQTLLDVVPVGIAVAEDPECQRIWANPWLSRLLGATPGENVASTSQAAEPMPYRLCRDGRELPPAERPMRYAAAHGEEIRNMEVEVLYQDGRAIQLLESASPLFDETGQVRGCVATYIDITERQRMEAQLRDSVHEKEVLLREVHHRVKNNLQVISSLLDLQADVAADPRVRAVFEESQSRIQAMALIYENLYQSETLTKIDAAVYLRNLSQRLFDAFRAPGDTITLTLEAQPVMLPPQIAIPFGLLLNELLSNALKHAFPDGRAGTIHIALRQESSGQCVLTVRDTGVGFPEGLDIHQADSLGLQLIGLLTEQLGGTVALTRDAGTIFTITFPV
jgi:two-component sensor histidine kinase/PAS domain-containing protein